MLPDDCAPGQRECVARARASSNSPCGKPRCAGQRRDIDVRAGAAARTQRAERTWVDATRNVYVLRQRKHLPGMCSRSQVMTRLCRSVRKPLHDTVNKADTAARCRQLRTCPSVHTAELELSAENDKGEKVVTGRATVVLPSRG